MKPRKEREQARQGVVEARRDMREARDTGAVTQALENYLRQMSDRLGEARARMLPDMLPLPKDLEEEISKFGPLDIKFEEEEHPRATGGKFTTKPQKKEPEMQGAPKRPKVPQPEMIGAPKPRKAPQPEMLGVPKREAGMADPARLAAGGTTAQQYMEQLGLMQATQAAAQAQQAVAQASQQAAAAATAVATQQAHALSQHALQIAQMAYETAMRSQMGAQTRDPMEQTIGVGGSTSPERIKAYEAAEAKQRAEREAKEKAEEAKKPAKPKEKKTEQAGFFDAKKIKEALVAEAKRRQEKESDPEVALGRRAAQLREAGFKGELSPDLLADPKKFDAEMKKLGKKAAGGYDFPLSSKDKFIVYTAALQERAKSDLVKRITKGSSRDEPNVTHRLLPQVGGAEPVAPHKPPRPPKPPQQKQMRVDPRAVEGPRVRTVKLPRISTYLQFPK